MKQIKPGDFVSIYDSREVYKVLEVDATGRHFSLIDAENRHKGTYPRNELKRIARVKEIRMWVKA